MSNFADPLIVVWHTDGSGNKISIQRNNENYVVTNGRFLLDYIPDQFYKVTFSSPASMVEVPLRNQIANALQYKVDYTNGMVYVDSTIEATPTTVSYYSRGLISYPASRIYTEQDGMGSVTETLQEKVDEMLSTIINYDSTESSRVTAEGLRVIAEGGRVTAEGLRVTAEGIRVASEDIRISQEDARVTEESTRVTTFDNFLTAKDVDWVNFKDDKDDEWDEFAHKGDYNGGVVYKKYNIVKSGTSTYMAIQNTTAGISTANSAYWRVIAVNGDNFTPRGIYNGATAYSQYDIVTYQNGIYMAKGSTTGNVPTNATYWDEYLKLDVLSILYQNVIADSTRETTYADGLITSLTWKDATTTATIRTDTFAYEEDSTTQTVTEVRTLSPGGETLTTVSVFDLDGNFLSGSSTSNI